MNKQKRYNKIKGNNITNDNQLQKNYLWSIQHHFHAKSLQRIKGRGIGIVVGPQVSLETIDNFVIGKLIVKILRQFEILAIVKIQQELFILRKKNKFQEKIT